MQLAAQHLTVKRGGRTILAKLSFSLRSGEALLLTGPNGSGKTTLIRTIAGFLRPEKGTVSLLDDGTAVEIAEQCHYVGHLNAVKASLTVAENLAFWARFLGPGGMADAESASGAGAGGVQTSLPLTSQVEAALQRFNLASLRHIPAGYLSAGQKRRLGLARLLVANRPLWLLDEPTVSLDTNSQQILAGAVNEHVSAGGMAIAATHLPIGLTSPRELRLGGGTTADLGPDLDAELDANLDADSGADQSAGARLSGAAQDE